MTNCIKWDKYLYPNGYGQANIGNGRHIVAHKWAWIQNNGTIPKGMVLDHVCHNEAAERGECLGGACEHRACVNVEHLRLVSQSENILAGLHSMDVRGACPKGHSYAVKGNIMVRANGRRECAECNRIRARANYAKRKAA